MILALFFIYLPDGCSENPAPTLQSCYKIFFMLKYILIIKNACERLFDELVKEWLKNRYSIISRGDASTMRRLPANITWPVVSPGKHVFMHHPTLSLFRPSDHPPGGLQRRTPNRNCLYRVLLLRQGLLHKLSDHTEERYEIPKIFNQKFPRFSIISPSSTPSYPF